MALADIYAVISYSRSHQVEVDAYRHEQDAAADQAVHELEAEHPEMFELQRKLRERHKRD